MYERVVDLIEELEVSSDKVSADYRIIMFGIAYLALSLNAYDAVIFDRSSSSVALSQNNYLDTVVYLFSVIAEYERISVLTLGVLLIYLSVDNARSDFEYEYHIDVIEIHLIALSDQGIVDNEILTASVDGNRLVLNSKSVISVDSCGIEFQEPCRRLVHKVGKYVRLIGIEYKARYVHIRKRIGLFAVVYRVFFASYSRIDTEEGSLSFYRNAVSLRNAYNVVSIEVLDKFISDRIALYVDGNIAVTFLIRLLHSLSYLELRRDTACKSRVE